ncbi:2-hydroxyacid dehydrogenase [Falsirhodobacter halotolerans]|uniref:2-hydroxyacid dehydrogenase n=1 Tax=Falsirhodobacter halotolerans TaxID=1146892 RepID=UPI001FCFFECB|nr:glyoxylate/hydroxypyruvate reductase A [Falsirhodobacter halotolerans]MCJ8140979.1 glyoxylate/hydroxypyruvate reductase A [Falsirhodobacter halotolerans]
MALLLTSTPERQVVWRAAFAAAGEPFFASEAEVTDPGAVTQIACWTPPADLSRYPNLDCVICVGAGTDHLSDLPEGVTLVRTLSPGLDAMVRDWVTMAALCLHRDLPAYVDQARRGAWQARPVRTARSRRVGIMGMGRIGALAAESLRSLGFEVEGYSRSGRGPGGIKVHGADGIGAFLARSDLLVCLMPLTDQTRGALNDALFAALPPGAMLVHAGRGAQLDMDAMRRALDAGHLSTAMLDVTNPEPLPPDHWAWTDPRVIVTPHVAAQTDAADGAAFALQVVAAARAGMPLPGVVDRGLGY